MNKENIPKKINSILIHLQEITGVSAEDLDELLTLSDKISVIYRGSITYPEKTSKLDRLKIGLMMSGNGF